MLSLLSLLCSSLLSLWVFWLERIERYGEGIFPQENHKDGLCISSAEKKENEYGSWFYTESSTGAPQPDGALNKAARMKIRHYRQIYAERPDPIVFLPIAVSTSGRVYEDYVLLLFLHVYREASILTGELPEQSEQFRFLRASLWLILKAL